MRAIVVRVGVIAAMMTTAGSMGVASPDQLPQRNGGRFVYAVRVLCEWSGETNINVHNPNERTVGFTTKGIALEFGQGPTPPGQARRESLRSDWALLMGCEDMTALGAVGSTGAGDVIIDSGYELDVWATYTSIVAGGGIGETRVVRVPATQVRR